MLAVVLVVAPPLATGVELFTVEDMESNDSMWLCTSAGARARRQATGTTRWASMSSHIGQLMRFMWPTPVRGPSWMAGSATPTSMGS
jgi:hypothetical protein